MSNYEHGRVLAVNETRLGSELVSAHAAGVTSLTVEDPVDFDEGGGWLKVGDQVVEYSTYDDDTGEITLTTALDAAAEDGDRVFVWDALRQVVTTDKIAQVELDGDDDNTDPLEATIPLHLLDDLDEGIRGTTGESVLLEQDGDEWRIVDVLGLAAAGASGIRFWDQDVHVVTADDVAAGQATATLTHVPEPGSLHAIVWDWTTLQHDEFTLAGKTVTIPDPGGLLEVGDEIDFKYAYRVAGAERPAAPTLLRVPQGHVWKYATGLGSSTTYADPSFDDSAWSTGPSGFGWGTTYTSLIGTTTLSPLDVWTRIDVETSGGDLTFGFPAGADNEVWVYLDGVQVFNGTYSYTPAGHSITVPCAAGAHTIAARGWGDGNSGDILLVTIEEAATG